MDKVLKLENGQYDLIETVSYPNGGASYFYVRDQQAIIIDDGICNYKKDEKPFSYSLITDKQNTYMNKYAKVYRFLKEDMGIINEVITLPCKKEEIPIKYVANREDHADASPLEIDFENNFASVYGRNSLKYLQKEYGILDEQGNNYFLDYLLRTKHGDYAVEENGVTYHHPQQIGLERYRRQLQKQNTCTEWGIKLYRFSSEDCRFENRIEDDIKTFFGENTDEFEENGLLADRPVKLYEHQENTLEEIQKQRAAGINTFLVVFPTASGKSRIVEEDLRIFSRKNTQFHALIMAPNTNIIDDWRQRVKKSLPDLQEQIEICSFAYMMRNYQKYAQEKYNYIVVDEVHRAGSDSYQRIMSYFQPKFWLGMTASPERTDGFDIFNLFDHNIAYEIRLQQALKEDMLCPFHYFGITDIEINGEIMNDKTGLRNFSYLISDKRVEYILQQANYYGYSGERVKGLVFCSSKKEAQELSKKFNARGYYTAALAGDASEKHREACIDLLTKEVSEEEIQIHEKAIKNKVSCELEEMPYLDYIFTIDIFNEGVDIPEINQVLMLRPTESPIVFVQQLGRGLRKADDKEYVVIIDFIGNYMNNYMIPIALSGDRSYNKDSIRRYVSEGTRIIPGASTIHFDEISRTRIFQSIDSARTNDVKLLKESYEQLRYRLGRVPTVLDFKKYGAVDVGKYFNKFGSYYAFLVKYYGEEYETRLSAREANIIEFISKKVTNMKRPHELMLLRHLMRQDDRTRVYLEKIFNNSYEPNLAKKVEDSVVRNLTNEFPKEEERKKYEDCVLIRPLENGYQLDEKFQKLLIANPIFAQMVNELIEYGIENYKENYSDTYKDTNFQLYQKYTYEDVCRLLNWKKNMNAQNIGGYFYDSDTKTLPVFINYDKAENAIAYEDRFVTQAHLIALSKHPRKIDSSDADHFFKRTDEDKDNKILLFIRKNKDDKEAKEFYFLGEIYAQGEPIPIKMEKTGDDAFEINYKLDVPVREDIYEYIVREA